MSFLDRIRAVNHYDWSNFRSFRVAGVRLGFVKHSFAEVLSEWPEVFHVTPSDVSLAGELNTARERTAATQEILLILRERGVIRGWRDEQYAVNRFFSEPPFLLMERAAVPYFGVCAYGVHVNAFVRAGADLRMWIGRRSISKFSEPGKLDQLVAGGQPAGMGLMDNLIKESWEEAGIPAEIARGARPVGAISYCREVPHGLRPDVIFNYDLELPPGFSPVNHDGEMEEFYLWPIDRVIETVRETSEFKLNCALVVIDFLIRHGYLSPEEADYMEILYGLLAWEKALVDYDRGFDAMV